MRKLLAVAFATAAVAAAVTGPAFADKSPPFGAGSCGTPSNGQSNVTHNGSFTTYDNGQGNGGSKFHDCTSH